MKQSDFGDCGLAMPYWGSNHNLRFHIVPVNPSVAVAAHVIVRLLPLQHNTVEGGLPSVLSEGLELTCSGRMRSKTVATLNIPPGLILLGPS